MDGSGLRDRAARGEAARWSEAEVRVDGETVGIALFSHPSNVRHPCRWHARLYGLYAANPFGHHQFTSNDTAAPKQGALTIDSGSSLTRRYHVLLHRGTLTSEELEAEFAKYARE